MTKTRNSVATWPRYSESYLTNETFVLLLAKYQGKAFCKVFKHPTSTDGVLSNSSTKFFSTKLSNSNTGQNLKLVIKNKSCFEVLPNTLVSKKPFIERLVLLENLLFFQSAALPEVLVCLKRITSIVIRNDRREEYG